MTIETTSRDGLPIRADELERRDQVLLFGRAVELMDVQMVRDFPTCVNLVIRPLPGGSPRETLVPRDLLLMGRYLPRLFRQRCEVCRAAMLWSGDLAKGSPRRALCAVCAGVVDEATVPLPAVAAAGRR